jgi:DNA/RNA-binding domain of Phe-tRNA-synthetase-like protein
MTEYFYSISPDIFRMFPGYVRGVVIAHNVHNSALPDELVQILRQSEQSVRDRLSIDTIASEPHVNAWREAYRKFGAKPSEFRSSIEAMARRALRNDPLPSINTLVDIGNALSLRHLIPTGGHAIDLLRGDIALRLASGAEEFVPFGGTELEHPLPGEVIFAEGNTVLTRRWTWRQANHTLTLPETSAIEFNIDGLPPTTPVDVEKTCAEVVELVQRFCGGKIRVEILTEANPRISLAE